MYPGLPVIIRLDNMGCGLGVHLYVECVVKMERLWRLTVFSLLAQEIGYTQMRILDGLGTLLQLSGLVARLCRKTLLE